MRRYSVSPQARQDLRDIRKYIAADNVVAARRVLANLKAALENLARMPGQGHKREDLTDKPVLFWPVGAYLIVYNSKSRPIEIVRVLHGARDVASLL